MLKYVFFPSDQLGRRSNSALQRCWFSCTQDVPAERGIFLLLALQHPSQSALFTPIRDLLLQCNLELRALAVFRESRLGSQVAVNRQPVSCSRVCPALCGSSAAHFRIYERISFMVSCLRLRI
jgi:hypothetical protein